MPAITTQPSSIEEMIREALGSALLPKRYREEVPRIVERIGNAEAPPEPESPHPKSPRPDPYVLTKEQVVEQVLQNADLLTQLDGNEEMVQSRILELTTKLHSIQAARDTVRKDMRLMMARNGVYKAKNPIYTITLTKGKDKLVCNLTPEAMQNIAPEFVRTKIEINKAALAKHYKDTGEIVEGCDVVEGDYTLTVRR